MHEDRVEQRVELVVKRSALIQELEGGIFVVSWADQKRQSTTPSGMRAALNEAFAIQPKKRPPKEG